jgi:hypothetical protein
VKVISIIQPWATLIALGEKKFETRSWATKHRGELAIHASKKVDKAICENEPFKSVLEKYGYTSTNLPTGVILAKCKLVDCLQVILNEDDRAVIELGKDFIQGNEYSFGDFSEGRFAWDLQDVEQIEHIPAKGQLGLWKFDMEVAK